MRTVSYEVIGLATAKERNLPGPLADFDDFDDWFSGVWRCEDGAPVEYVGDDVCEPEDAVLRRDWRWVAVALQAAYDLGRSTAAKMSDGY